MGFLIFGAIFSVALVIVTFIGAMLNEKSQWKRVGFMVMCAVNAFDAGIFFTIIVQTNKLFM